MSIKKRIDWTLDKLNLYFDCYDVIFNDETDLIIEKKHRGRIETMSDDSYLSTRFYKTTAKAKSFNDIDKAIEYLETDHRVI